MSIVAVKEPLEAGVHFGHPASRWNPGMKPFIHSKRNGIHIIDLKQTVRGLIRAYHFLQRLCGDGKSVLFVGTKRQAKNTIIAEARRSGQPYVSERWLGGMLTNFYTIRTRLKRLDELEELEKLGATGGVKKKQLGRIVRERKKITKNLDGIRNLERLPGALMIIDPKMEHIAVAEANKLGIPVVALLDTDCNPRNIDIPIPGNDDAMRAIQIVLGTLAEAILSGTRDWKVKEAIIRREEIRHRQRAEAAARKRRDEAERKAREAAAKEAAQAVAESTPEEAAPVENSGEAAAGTEKAEGV